MQSKKALTYHGIDGCRYGWIMVSVSENYFIKDEEKLILAQILV